MQCHTLCDQIKVFDKHTHTYGWFGPNFWGPRGDKTTKITDRTRMHVATQVGQESKIPIKMRWTVVLYVRMVYEKKKWNVPVFGLNLWGPREQVACIPASKPLQDVLFWEAVTIFSTRHFFEIGIGIRIGEPQRCRKEALIVQRPAALCLTQRQSQCKSVRRKSKNKAWKKCPRFFCCNCLIIVITLLQ